LGKEHRDLFVYDTIWYYSFTDSSTGNDYVYLMLDSEDELLKVRLKNPQYTNFQVFCKKNVYPFFIN